MKDWKTSARHASWPVESSAASLSCERSPLASKALTCPAFLSHAARIVSRRAEPPPFSTSGLCMPVRGICNFVDRKLPNSRADRGCFANNSPRHEETEKASSQRRHSLLCLSGQQKPLLDLLIFSYLYGGRNDPFAVCETVNCFGVARCQKLRTWLWPKSNLQNGGACPSFWLRVLPRAHARVWGRAGCPIGLQAL